MRPSLFAACDDLENCWKSFQSDVQASIVHQQDQLSDLEHEYEIFLKTRYIEELKLLDQILSGISVGHIHFKEFFETFEVQFSNWTCHYVFDEEALNFIQKMNHLHAFIHDDFKEFQKWLKLRSLTEDVMKHLEPGADGELSESNILHWSFKQFYLDLSNILLHKPSYLCRRPQDRSAKPLEAFFHENIGPTALRERLNLILYLQPKQPRRAEAFEEAYKRFLDYIETELSIPPQIDGELSSLYQSWLNRIQEIEELQISFENLAEPGELRVDMLYVLVDAYGVEQEFGLPLTRTSLGQNQSAELLISQEKLLEAYQVAGRLHLLKQYIRISKYQNDQRIAHLDLGFQRPLGERKFYLRAFPRYFPLNSQHDREALADLIYALPQEGGVEGSSFILFLEDLSHIPVVYDQLRVDDGNGNERKIPVLDLAAEKRHLGVQKSWKLAASQEQIHKMTYSSNPKILDKAFMKVQLKLKSDSGF